MFPRRFASPNFPYCSQLHHNAAARKSTLCKLLIYKDLVGASGFEPEASCAQGRRAHRIQRWRDLFLEFPLRSRLTLDCAITVTPKPVFDDKTDVIDGWLLLILRKL